jgi:hypothetical protein
VYDPDPMQATLLHWMRWAFPILLCCACAPKGPVVSPGPAIECSKPEIFGPSLVSQQDYENRYGAGMSRFSELPTSTERPLEACGLEAALDQLARASCDDGTNPFGGDPRKAHESRAGSMGSGGRCGAIIDLYEVRCPEARYSVYVDMYFCGPEPTEPTTDERVAWGGRSLEW